MRRLSALLAAVLSVVLVASMTPQAEAGRRHGCSSGSRHGGYRSGGSSYGVSFSFGGGGCYGGSYYGGSAYYRGYPYSSCYGRSYRVGGRGYSYSGCGPVYVYRPTYRSSCGTNVYYGYVAPRNTVTYVYVDPPTSVATTTSGSAYHDWQASTRSAPKYEVVPRVVRADEASETDDWEDEDSTEAPSVEGEGTDEPEVIEVDPWEMLGRGDYASARDIFGAAAEGHRQSAEPRIGLALSSLALGDENEGANAMRRALVVEPEAFVLPEGEEEVYGVLDRTSRTLRSLRDGRERSADRWMAIAGVDSLRGDHGKAREAIKRAREYGESHLGAKNLWRLLGLSNKPLEKVIVSD